jgi:hypothetical protein
LTAAAATAEAGPRRVPWLGIGAAGLAIAGAVVLTSIVAAPPLLELGLPALWVFAGLVPVYLLAYLASRLRRARRRVLPGRWLYFWVFLRLAFMAAPLILAAASATAWAVGAAVAATLLQACLLTIVLSVMLGMAGNCVICLAQAIGGPERES